MNSIIRSLGLLLSILFAQTAALAETVTRTSAFVYDADGVLIREVVEPTNATLCVATQYTLDAYGNRSASQTRNCNSAAIPGVGIEAAAPPAPPTTASASGNYTQFTARTASTSYAATTANPTAGQFPTRNTNPLGHSETQAFDLRFGTVSKLTGPNGISTSWTYDAFGRKTREARADGSKTYWQYVLCASAVAGACPASIHGATPYYYIRTGDLSSANAQVGAVSRTFYDAQNRPIRTQTQIPTSSTAWTWRTQDTVYDAWGRVARASNTYLSDSTGHIAKQFAQWTYNYYDLLGRLVKEETQDPSATNTANRVNGRYVRTVAYNGLSTTSTNTKGQSTTRTHNVAGQLVNVTDAQNNTITYSHDALGNAIQTNASGVVSTVNYDLRGRKIAMTDMHMGTWQYRYNAIGELRLQQSGKGQLTTIAYDTLGRQTERREADLISNWAYDTHNGVCAAAPNTAKGKPTRSTTSTGFERIHCYDNLGREVSQRVAMDGNTFWSGTVYEAGTGRVARQVYPARVQPNVAPTTNAAPTSGASANYSVRNEYSAVGLVSQRNHTNSALLWQIHSHVPNSTARIERILLGNNRIDQVYLDSSNRSLFHLTGPSGTAYQQYERYQFDSEGNLSNRLWNDYTTPNGTVSYTQRTEIFTYDSLNRLTNTSGTTGVPAKAVSYNAQGNILTKDGRTYTYGNTTKPHRLTQITGSIHGASNPTYSYDANGNMLTGGGATVSWMSFNMVNTMSQGSQSSSFRYGPEHQRVKQTAAYNGQNITTWYIDNFELEKNTTSNTTQAKYYIAGKIIHIETGTSATPASVQTKYLHKDHLGSVALITSQTGAVLERYSYDAWGKRRNINGTDYTANGGHLLGATDRGYTGHEHLDHLGLVHMNGRIYDASLGRFMSADPFIAQATNLQNYNRYAYVNNNPLSYTDPSGYWSWNPFKAVKQITRAVFKALGPEVSSLVIAVGAGIACGPAAPGCAAWVVGNGTYHNSRAQGASSNDAFKSAASAGVSVYGAAMIGTGPYGVSAGQSASAQAIALHAGLNCASATIGGGDCKSAAITGGFTKAISPYVELYAGSDTLGQRVAGGVVASVIGGTVSELSGGKFANGAQSAAYIYLYNQLSRAASGAGMARGAAGAGACQSAECQMGAVDHQASAAMQMTRAWNRLWNGVYDLIFSDGDVASSTPTGQRGSPLDVSPGSNKPTNIGGRDYSGHALDRMQGRGVPPSAVEDAIQNGARTPGNTPGTEVHSGSNGVTVVTGNGGRVVTVITR
jgi:RHS repeat-associated protein